MLKTITLPGALLALLTVLAGCGSSTSTAPGVAQAPGGGATAAPVTAPPPSASASSSTTSSTGTSTTPLPAALKTKPKVVAPSGPAPQKLVVRDLIKGTGPAVKPGSTVTVQYVGVLYRGGKQFDASWDRGQPATFPLSGVIQGWQQGIPGMRVGGRRELIIPPGLAYKNAAQNGIPPNSTLVFVIDMHGVA